MLLDVHGGESTITGEGVYAKGPYDAYGQNGSQLRAPVERWPDPDEATAVKPVVTLESMPREAVMAADATVRPAEGVPTATAVAPVRVRGRAADEEQCCDQCGHTYDAPVAKPDARPATNRRVKNSIRPYRQACG